MNSHKLPLKTYEQNWICPNLGTYWKLSKVRDSDKIILRSLEGNTQFQFSAAEGFALQHFTGTVTLGKIQQRCRQHFGDIISANFVEELLQKLIALGILETELAPCEGEHGEIAQPVPNIQSPILNSDDCSEWICPDLTPYWQFAQIPDSDQVVLKAIEGNLRVLFSATEGYALRYFTGIFTVSQIQDLSEQHFGKTISPSFMQELLQKLIELNILQLPASPGKQKGAGETPRLKSCVHWIEHPDGYWILRNPEDVTFLQVNDTDKTIIDQLEQRPLAAIAAEFCITRQYLKQLLQLLTVTAMLEGTTPPKPAKGKFNPKQLLSFRIPLFNPDPFLNQYIDSIRWIWTRSFAAFFLTFLAVSATVGINQREAILYTGKQLLIAHGSNLIVPFVLLSMLIVAIHEFGHAFTLKNYGGIVPEIGLLIIMFMPAAYTNTTDSYCLVKRFQRVLVVAAGILVQFTITAMALWLWNVSVEGTWLHTTSYLMMTAAMFTVAINLNPLAKFDGYYLAVALTGINNLRSRSFGLYSNLLQGKPIKETRNDALILATYAPLSLAYIWFVFGYLLLQIADWSFTNIPMTALILFTTWAIYFYSPSKK